MPDSLKNYNKSRETIGQPADQLAADRLAHEINNTLAVVAGFAELSLLESALPPGIQANLQHILEASQHGRELVNDTLDMLTGTSSVVERVDFARVEKDVRRFLQPAIGKGVYFISAIQNPSIGFEGRTTHIRQILINLALNATTAMDGSGTLRLTIDRVTLIRKATGLAGTTAKAGDYVRLSVQDTGPGIAVTERERVFRPYVTSSPGVGHHGMGLAIVLGLVRRYAGMITMHNVRPKGLKVDVYLPAAVRD